MQWHCVGLITIKSAANGGLILGPFLIVIGNSVRIKCKHYSECWFHVLFVFFSPTFYFLCSSSCSTSSSNCLGIEIYMWHVWHVGPLYCTGKRLLHCMSCCGPCILQSNRRWEYWEILQHINTKISSTLPLRLKWQLYDNENGSR